MPIPCRFRDRVRARLEAELNQKILPRLIARFAPERVILFGSLARGDVHELSDIDLVIVAETELDFFQRIGAVLACCRDRQAGLQPFVYTPQEFAQMQAERRAQIAALEEEGLTVYRRGDLTD